MKKTKITYFYEILLTTTYELVKNGKNGKEI